MSPRMEVVALFVKAKKETLETVSAATGIPVELLERFFYGYKMSFSTEELGAIRNYLTDTIREEVAAEK